MRIALCGNIGSGKSSVLQRLSLERKRFTAEEPVHLWTDWLDLFYTHPERYAFGIQVKILNDLVDLDRTFAQHYKETKANVVFERSPFDTVHVFGTLLRDDGKLHTLEWDLLRTMYSEYGWTPDVVIYLRTSPSTCVKRIVERDRKSERAIDHNYIRSLHDRHESLLRSGSHAPPFEVFTVDANVPIDKVTAAVANILDTLE
eukprot:9483694-Pyramimonas_sp.AAC.3